MVNDKFITTFPQSRTHISFSIRSDHCPLILLSNTLVQQGRRSLVLKKGVLADDYKQVIEGIRTTNVMGPHAWAFLRKLNLCGEHFKMDMVKHLKEKACCY